MWRRRPWSSTSVRPVPTAPVEPNDVPKPVRLSWGSFQFAITNSIPAPSDDKPVTAISRQKVSDSRKTGVWRLTTATGCGGHLRAAVARGAQGLGNHPAQRIAVVERIEPGLGDSAGAGDAAR